MSRLSGKRALVTGGGSGIGRATVYRTLQWMVGAGVELGQRRVERAPAGAAGCQRLLGRLPLEHEGLAGKVFCPLDVGGNWKRRGLSGRCDGFSHDGLQMRR